MRSCITNLRILSPRQRSPRRDDGRGRLTVVQVPIALSSRKKFKPKEAQGHVPESGDPIADVETACKTYLHGSPAVKTAETPIRPFPEPARVDIRPRSE